MGLADCKMFVGQLGIVDGPIVQCNARSRHLRRFRPIFPPPAGHVPSIDPSAALAARALAQDARASSGTVEWVRLVIFLFSRRGSIPNRAWSAHGISDHRAGDERSPPNPVFG